MKSDIQDLAAGWLAAAKRQMEIVDRNLEEGTPNTEDELEAIAEQKRRGERLRQALVMADIITGTGSGSTHPVGRDLEEEETDPEYPEPVEVDDTTGKKG